jgi:hypothetical protein
MRPLLAFASLDPALTGLLRPSLQTAGIAKPKRYLRSVSHIHGLAFWRSTHNCNKFLTTDKFPRNSFEAIISLRLKLVCKEMALRKSPSFPRNS